MGLIHFKPAGRRALYGVLGPTKAEKYIQLPFRMQKSNGLVLHVDPYNNDQLHYKLEKSVDATNLTKIIVIGTINQKVVYRNSLILENNMAEATIPAAAFPGGVIAADGI